MPRFLANLPVVAATFAAAVLAASAAVAVKSRRLGQVADACAAVMPGRTPALRAWLQSSVTRGLFFPIVARSADGDSRASGDRRSAACSASCGT